MSTTPGNGTDPQADPAGEAPPGESFMSHLVELRQRVVRAAGSVLLVFVLLSPFMKQIFDAVSLPLMTALPAGTKLTDVVNALNSLGATPQELVVILQAIKAAGALNAEIEVI